MLGNRRERQLSSKIQMHLRYEYQASVCTFFVAVALFSVLLFVLRLMLCVVARFVVVAFCLLLFFLPDASCMME